MELRYRNKAVAKMDVGGAVLGHKGDEVVMRGDDVHALYRALRYAHDHPSELARMTDWLNHLMTRMVPYEEAPATEYHWFLVDAFGWSTAEFQDLPRAIRGLQKLTPDARKKKHQFNVWKVPGPESLEYSIDEYRPQVEGAEFFGQMRFG